MSKSVAVIQSSYIPWKGYFDLIASSDAWVVYDDAQYTRRDWRNRNRIKGPHGLVWLSVPVKVKGRYTQAIRETEIADPRWARKHLATIEHAYARTPHFERYREAMARAYADCGGYGLLSEVNAHLLAWLLGELAITTERHDSAEFDLRGDATDKLLRMCLDLGADRYLSGPAARSYLDTRRFEEHGIRVEWMNYDGYPEYPQPHGAFEHAVSVIDLLMCTGPEARRFMKAPSPTETGRA